MQPHRKGYVLSFTVLPEQESVGTAIEDARHIVRMMGVEIEHGGEWVIVFSFLRKKDERMKNGGGATNEILQARGHNRFLPTDGI